VKQAYDALCPPRSGSVLPRPMRAVLRVTSVIRAFTSAPPVGGISSVAIERSCASLALGIEARAA
jgi:hypothetical protein